MTKKVIDPAGATTKLTNEAISSARYAAILRCLATIEEILNTRSVVNLVVHIENHSDDKYRKTENPEGDSLKICTHQDSMGRNEAPANEN
jgi:hypothetical protein